MRFLALFGTVSVAMTSSFEEDPLFSLYELENDGRVTTPEPGSATQRMGKPTVSERKAVLRYMKTSPMGKLDPVAVNLRMLDPASAVTAESLDRYRVFVLMGTIVPGWFHAACRDNCRPETLGSQETINALVAAAPVSSSFAKSRNTIAKMAHVWYLFCLRPLWTGPNMTEEPPCGRVKDGEFTGGFENAYRLSRTQLNKYLDTLIDE